MPEESKNIKKPEKTFKVESKPIDPDRKASREEHYFDKALARKDAIAEKLHSLIIRSMPWIYWPAAVLVTVIVLLIILGVIVVRVWHLLLGPEYYVWLGDEELSDIDKILGAILGGGLLGSRIQKFFSKKSS